MYTLEAIKIKPYDDATKSLLQEIIEQFKNLNNSVKAYVWIKYVQLSINGKTISESDIPELDEDADDYSFFHDDSEICQLLNTSNIQDFELVIDYIAVPYSGAKYGYQFFKDLFENSDTSALSALEIKSLEDSGVSIRSFISENGKLIDVNQNRRVKIRPANVASIVPEVSQWHSNCFNVIISPGIGKRYNKELIKKLIDLSVDYFEKYAIEDEDQCIEDYEELKPNETLSLPTFISVEADKFEEFYQDVSKFITIANENEYQMTCGGNFMADGKYHTFGYLHMAFETLEYFTF